MNYVLPAVAYSCFANAETLKSSTCTNTCDVHGIIFDRVFLGEKTMHHMQLSVFSNCIPNLLQWTR